MRDWPWYYYFIIAVLIFGLFFIFYYRPKNDELNRIKDERQQTENEVARLKQKKRELDQIEAELKQMNIQLGQLETIIPQREEIDVILRRIQQMAMDSRINITKFIPRALIDQEFYSEKPINMEMTGNYHNLAIFFSRLSNFARLFNIQDFNVKAIRDQSDTTTLTATTTAKTYIFKETPPPSEEPPQKKTPRKKK